MGDYPQNITEPSPGGSNEAMEIQPYSKYRPLEANLGMKHGTPGQDPGTFNLWGRY